MQLLIFVEGPSDEKVLENFLRRWLQSDDLLSCIEIELKFVSFGGCGRLIKRLGTAAKGHLTAPNRDDDVVVVALLDFKGPEDCGLFPKKGSVDDRYKSGKSKLEREVGHERFRAFFAVHEIEAWLFSERAIFASRSDGIVDALFDGVNNPEEINADEPPSRRLDRIFKEHGNRNYRKITEGIQLFASLDPSIASASCPYLCSMFTEIRDLLLAVEDENSVE